MRDAGQLGYSYRKWMKPHLLKGVPAFRYATLVQDSATGELEYSDGLLSLPAHLLRADSANGKVLIRQEGVAPLADIKEFHKRVCKSQGLSEAEFLDHCQSLAVSVDGVREAPHAKKTLKLVSVRFGERHIYLYKVFNYNIGVEEAKPTMEDILE